MFAQQAYIHDYLNFFLAPFGALIGGYVANRIYIRLNLPVSLIISISLVLLVFFERRAFFLAINNSQVGARYLAAARLITAHCPQNGTVYVAAPNYFNFSRETMANYAYGYNQVDLSAFAEDPNTFLNQLSSGQCLLTASTNPLSAGLTLQLDSNYPETFHDQELTLYLL